MLRVYNKRRDQVSKANFTVLSSSYTIRQPAAGRETFMDEQRSNERHSARTTQIL